MMDAHSETEEQFFDTRDEVSSESDLGSDCSDFCVSSGHGDCAIGYDFWTKKPDCVSEKRGMFLKWMGLRSDWHINNGDEEEGLYNEVMKSSIDRLMDNGEAVLANLDSNPQIFPSHCSHYFWSFDTTDLTEGGTVEETLTWKNKNLDNGTELVVDKRADDGTFTRLHKVGSDKTESLERSQKTLGSSSLVQQFMREDTKGFNLVNLKEKVKGCWRQRVSAMTHIADRTKWFLDKPNEINSKTWSNTRRVCVHVSKKHTKELSSLYTGQEFPAHDGSILTMKFSPDGQCLASAGVDGVVHVWRVLEDDIINKFNAQDIDPSCLYFSLNSISKLAPLDAVNDA